MFEYVNVNTVLCNLSLKRCRCKKDALHHSCKMVQQTIETYSKDDRYISREVGNAFKEILLKYKEIGPINPSTS